MNFSIDDNIPLETTISFKDLEVQLSNKTIKLLENGRNFSCITSITSRDSIHQETWCQPIRIVFYPLMWLGKYLTFAE